MRLEAVNKKIGIIAIVVVLILGSIGVVRFFTKEDQKTALTVVEKKWIEDNKNNVIDFATLNNVPIVSDNGSGLLFDFLDDLETETDLEFNKLSYDNGEDTTAEYSLTKQNEISSDDLVLYQDNYILVTKENDYYTDVDEIKDLTIGVLNDDQKAIEEYLTGSSKITYRAYDSNDAVLTALTNNEVTAIALPKLDYLESILTSDDIHISYNITDGGDGGRGLHGKRKPHTEEAKIKMSKSRRGLLVGSKNPMYGRHETNPAYGKFGKSHPASKGVNQYTINGAFIKHWNCLSDVERELKIKVTHITACCNGRQKTAGGYTWKRTTSTK